MEKKLQLEPLDKNSLTLVTTWLNKKWLDNPIKRMRAVLELSEWLEGIDEAEARAYIVLDGQKQIGCILFDKINWITGHSWLHIIHDAQDLGGVIEAAKARALALNLNKISTEVLAGATPQTTAFEAAGFKVEVRKRQAHFSKGAYRTVLEMAWFVGSDERTSD